MEEKDSESSFAETVPTGPWHLFPGLPHREAEPSKGIQVKQIGMEGILGGCTFPAPTHKQYFFLIERIFNYQLILEGCGLLLITVENAAHIYSLSLGAGPSPFLPKDSEHSGTQALQTLLGFQCLIPPFQGLQTSGNPSLLQLWERGIVN